MELCGGLRGGLGMTRVVLLQGPQPVPFRVGKFGVVRGAEILLPADSRRRATGDRTKDGRVGGSAAALAEGGRHRSGPRSGLGGGALWCRGGSSYRRGATGARGLLRGNLRIEGSGSRQLRERNDGGIGEDVDHLLCEPPSGLVQEHLYVVSMAHVVVHS